MRKKEKYLGEILVEKGLITEGQLQIVIQEQMRSKKFLGAMLIEKGLLLEDDLLRALAEQFGIGSVRLKDIDIDWDVAMAFPSSLVTDNQCFPVQVSEDTVTLLISNPLDVWAIERAETEVAPRKLKILLVTISDMEEAIKMYRLHAIRSMMDRWKRDE